MTDVQSFHIDLIKLRELADIGVRRAVLFMGLGLNAANRADFNDYELNKLPRVEGQTELPITFFPSDLPQDRVDVFKSEFATWITGAGLRELIEHFSTLLDNIHFYSLVIKQSNGTLGELNPQKLQNKFENRGFTEKSKLLKDTSGIEIPHADYIDPLYTARNCLAHAQGIVRKKHCTIDSSLVLRWLAFETIAVGQETGQEHYIIDLVGKVTTEPMQVAVRQITRERTFSLKEKLLLSQQDLWEICAFFSLAAIPNTIKAFADFCTAQGVKEAVEEAAAPAAKAN